MEHSREMGVVKRWDNKGFGFVIRDNDSSSVFCHVRELGGVKSLVPGSKVSFYYEPDEKGGKAKQVVVEEAIEEVEEVRETGTVKRWNAEKGFGFIGRDQGGDDAFVHKKDCGGKDLSVGQAVSFVLGEGAKGASAKKVQEEEGGAAPVIEEEDEGEREFGKVKSYNEEKGFAFIGRCVGGEDLFAHKREFGTLEPYVGQPVSFVVETTEKGDAAKKVREEDSVPEMVLSDEGREFGVIKNFIAEKGFGFIVRKAGGADARFFEKQCGGMVIEKDMCVSFVLEESDKGPSAKDVREEDPERVARVTAKVHYGKVSKYFDPTPKRPTNGFGFIVPHKPSSYGAPDKYYFHMSEIETPDEDGGIDEGTNVSFIAIPAKKGIQAAAVTIADPPEEPREEEASQPTLETSFAEMGITESIEAGAVTVAVDLDDPNAW